MIQNSLNNDADERETLINEFVEQDEQTEPTKEINYDTLLKIHPYVHELEENEQQQAQSVAFYCKDCNALCQTERKKGKKLKFICQKCAGERIYFGSELGLSGFFHLKGK